MGIWPLWLPGGGNADPGVASPESAEPATPGLPPDGSDPGMYPGDGDFGTPPPSEEGEWGQQPPPDENNPWAPDDPEPKDGDWGGGDDSGGGGGGGGGGGFWDLF